MIAQKFTDPQQVRMLSLGMFARELVKRLVPLCKTPHERELLSMTSDLLSGIAAMSDEEFDTAVTNAMTEEGF